MIEATNMTTTLTVILTLIFLAVLLWFISPQLGKTLVKLDMSSQLSKAKLQEKSVTLDNGRKAWYLERMNKQDTDEKPLVVVPGLSAYMRLMGVQFADLLKLIPNRRVIIFELPYHGKRASMNESFVDPGCSLDAMTASLERFLTKIGLTDSFDLMGYSLGGTIATNYTIRNPSNINRLVLLAPYYYNEATTEDYNAIFESKKWSSLAAWKGREEMERWFHDWLGMEKEDVLPGFIMSGLAALRSEYYPENHWIKFYEQLDVDCISTKTLLEDNKANLGAISSPILVLTATTDKICDYKKLANLKNFFNPDLCTIKNLDAGHCFAPKGKTLFEIAAEDTAKFLNS
ncbi:MAG: hypothetical protein CL983_05230 [Euryarchaeota archaeon]|nr:hypothetical protein [Euryarchaeota archaeon]|tara:strand:+ start:647 stop:1681 length:1035 start_codon:yes stop_codon:yes gene_type:complete